MIRRVRGRATFAALAGAQRHVRGSITVRCAPGPAGTPPRVAYGVGRGVGTAVQRNRVRRRLRAAVGVCEAQLADGAAYLVSAGREVLMMPFGQLVDSLGQLFEASGRRGRAEG